MNIKGLFGANIMPEVRSVNRTERAIRSDMAHDRDANGQQAFGEGKKEKPPMSDEQLQKALDHLRQLPAVKEHKWTVQLVTEDQAKYVLIKDNLGNPIRKIPEAELWTLRFDAPPTSTGQLLKRAA